MPKLTGSEIAAFLKSVGEHPKFYEDAFSRSYIVDDPKTPNKLLDFESKCRVSNISGVDGYGAALGIMERFADYCETKEQAIVDIGGNLKNPQKLAEVLSKLSDLPDFFKQSTMLENFIKQYQDHKPESKKAKEEFKIKGLQLENNNDVVAGVATTPKPTTFINEKQLKELMAEIKENPDFFEELFSQSFLNDQKRFEKHLNAFDHNILWKMFNENKQIKNAPNKIEVLKELKKIFQKIKNEPAGSDKLLRSANYREFLACVKGTFKRKIKPISPDPDRLNMRARYPIFGSTSYVEPRDINPSTSNAVAHSFTPAYNKNWKQNNTWTATQLPAHEHLWHYFLGKKHQPDLEKLNAIFERYNSITSIEKKGNVQIKEDSIELHSKVPGWMIATFLYNNLPQLREVMADFKKFATKKVEIERWNTQVDTYGNPSAAILDEWVEYRRQVANEYSTYAEMSDLLNHYIEIVVENTKLRELSNEDKVYPLLVDVTTQLSNAVLKKAEEESGVTRKKGEVLPLEFWSLACDSVAMRENFIKFFSQRTTIIAKDNKFALDVQANFPGNIALQYIIVDTKGEKIPVTVKSLPVSTIPMSWLKFKPEVEWDGISYAIPDADLLAPEIKLGNNLKHIPQDKIPEDIQLHNLVSCAPGRSYLTKGIEFSVGIVGMGEKSVNLKNIKLNTPFKQIPTILPLLLQNGSYSFDAHEMLRLDPQYSIQVSIASKNWDLALENQIFHLRRIPSIETLNFDPALLQNEECVFCKITSNTDLNDTSIIVLPFSIDEHEDLVFKFNFVVTRTFLAEKLIEKGFKVTDVQAVNKPIDPVFEKLCNFAGILNKYVIQNSIPLDKMSKVELEKLKENKSDILERSTGMFEVYLEKFGKHENFDIKKENVDFMYDVALAIDTIIKIDNILEKMSLDNNPDNNLNSKSNKHNRSKSG